MAYDPDMPEDDDAARKVQRAELEALRARLRAKAARLVEVIEDLEEPTTVSEAWRSVRLVRQADTMLIQLHADAGAALSSATGRGMQPARTVSSRYEDPADEQPSREQRLDKARQQIDRWIIRHSRDTGFWPNGETAGAEDEVTPERLTPSVDYTLPADVESKALILHLIIGQLNASVHHQAKAKGLWPDGTPFDPKAHDPGYYSVAQNMGSGTGHRTEDEDPGPPGLAWWVVRKRAPP